MAPSRNSNGGKYSMNDYPLPVKIVASLAIVLAYVIGLPLLGLMYAAGYWADRWERRSNQL